MTMADIKRISPEEANAKLGEGYTYVDVRTVEEFEAGHPAGALNVPIAFAGRAGMVENPDFVAVMAALFAKDANIVVGCKPAGEASAPRRFFRPRASRASSISARDGTVRATRLVR